MSYKVATYITLFVISGAGIILITLSSQLSKPSNLPIGPGFFPMSISILLVIMCIISAITTMRKKDSENEEFKVPNLRHILFTTITLIIYVLLWDVFGFSHFLSVLFLFGLFFVYNTESNVKKRLLKAVTFSIVVNLFVYIIFEKTLNIIF